MSNREKFEEWYSGTYHETIHMLPNGQYSSLRQQHSWGAWQARVPEGYVVVPVDLVDEIEDKIWDNLSSNHTITNQEGDGFIPVEDIDLGGIYKAMIEAVEK